MDLSEGGGSYTVFCIKIAKFYHQMTGYCKKKYCGDSNKSPYACV